MLHATHSASVALGSFYEPCTLVILRVLHPGHSTVVLVVPQPGHFMALTRRPFYGCAAWPVYESCLPGPDANLHSGLDVSAGIWPVGEFQSATQPSLHRVLLVTS